MQGFEALRQDRMVIGDSQNVIDQRGRENTDGNRSASRSRRSLGFIYFAERAREDVVTLEKYQQQIKQEWLASGRI